jgi:hypothetical protein
MRPFDRQDNSPEALGAERLARMPVIGRMRKFRQQGDLFSLIRDGGDNYAAYHAVLAEAWRRYGGPVSREDYAPDFEAYAEACTVGDDILMAEAMLRRMYLFRTRQARLAPGAGDADPTPLVDASGELVSIAAGNPPAVDAAITAVGSSAAEALAYDRSLRGRRGRMRHGPVPAAPAPARPDFSAPVPIEG